MSKERLKILDEIERRYMYRRNTMIPIWQDDYEYLIRIAKEQAERVQELDKELKQCKEYMAESTNYMNFSILKEQNKCYREAFKQIKLQILFDGTIEDHRKNIIEIIDRALEVSE